MSKEEIKIGDEVLHDTERYFDQIVDVLNQVDNHYDEFSFNRGNTKYEIYS